MSLENEVLSDSFPWMASTPDSIDSIPFTTEEGDALEFHISLPYPPQSAVVVYATTSVPHEAVVAYPSLLFFSDVNYNETQLIRVEGRDDGDAYDDDPASEVEIGIYQTEDPYYLTVDSSSFDILTRSLTYTRVAIDMEISEGSCSPTEGNSSSGCTLQFTLCKAFLSTCSQLLNGTDTFGSYIEEIIIGVEVSEEGLLYSTQSNIDVDD